MIQKSLLIVVLFLYIQASLQQNSAFYALMATRQERHHHWLWHQIRGLWNKFDSKTKTAIKNLGWEPTNPSQTSGGSTITNNYAGEDFLYMHQEMIKRANSYGGVNSWKKIPAPGDSEYPVSPVYSSTFSSSTLKEWKSDKFYQDKILPLEREFTDPKKLKGMSLNKLGYRIETTIHSYLHIRFSNPTASGIGYRSRVSNIKKVDEKWDNPGYTWLVDTYGSHCDPIFWKLHGWINDRIEQWKSVNSPTKPIQWKGTWTGGPMSNYQQLVGLGRLLFEDEPPFDPEYLDDTMAKLVAIIGNSGVKELYIGEGPSVKFSVVRKKPTKQNRRRL